MKPIWIQSLQGDHVERTAEFAQENIILGSGPAAHLRLEDPEVSRIHAMLKFDERGQLFLSDLGWSNGGTLLNGVKISEEVPIQEGAEICVGRTILRVFTTPPKGRSVSRPLSASDPAPPRAGSSGHHAPPKHGADVFGTSFAPAAPSRTPSGAADVFATGFGGPSSENPEGGGLQEGEVVGGRYQLRRPLGRGGMGEVWLAEDLRLHRPFALKFLAPELGGNPDALARLHREYEVLEKLSHPGIVRVFDLSEDPALGRVFLRMEYVEGGSVLERMEAPLKHGQRPLFPLPTLTAWFEQIVEALSYAHQQGILHRDLKPANLMLTSEGRIKVMDFGIARQVTGEESQHTTMLGSMFYAAPELARGMAATVGADIYSFGILVYELLTGDPPVGRFEMPSRRIVGLPSALDLPLEQMLAMDAKKRGGSLREAWLPLHQALKAPLEPPTQASAQTKPPAPTKPPTSSKASQVQVAASEMTQAPSKAVARSAPQVLPVESFPSEFRVPRRRRGFGKALVWLLLLGGIAGAGWWLVESGRWEGLRASGEALLERAFGGAARPRAEPLPPRAETPQETRVEPSPPRAETPQETRVEPSPPRAETPQETRVEPSPPRAETPQETRASNPLRPNPFGDVLLEQSKPSKATESPAPSGELPSGWAKIKEAYEACHPSAECSAEDGQKAARLFREAREGLQPPVPAWVLMAWEGASLAKAKALAEPYRRYEEANQAYEAWKKQNGYRGAKLRFYTQLQSHRVFGKLLWFASVSEGSAVERQRLLGELWQGWRFSPLARDAYYRWMQALGQGGYSIVRESELLNAARALILPTYRQNQIALRFFRYLKSRPASRQNAQWGMLDAYKNLREWSSLLAEGRSLLAGLPLPSHRRSRASKRALNKRLWLITAIAEALLHTEGLEAAASFLRPYEPLSPKDRYRYLGSVLAWQREKGQLAEASQTLQALLDLQHASPSQTRRLRHSLAAQHLAQGEATRAGNLWASLAQDFSLSVEDKLPLYFWAGVAAEKASSSGGRYFRELCTGYPLSWYGFLSCARLKRAPSLSPPPPETDPLLSNPTALALKSHSKDRELLAFFAWNELHQSPAPSAGLVIASARAFAEAGDWETAFQTLLQHQLQPLYQGRLPLDVLRLAFPHPSDAWPAIQRAASSASVEAEAMLSIIRRESGFSFPSFGLRSGLMGLDPLWSSETPKEHQENLRLGAERLASHLRRFSSLPLAFAAYRGQEDFLQSSLGASAFAKDQPLLWLEFFDPILQEYTLSSFNGTLWYYLFYRWLASPSSVPSFSWLP